MNLADSLQQRIDALKRQCRTGYSCGSTCISLRKECRTSPGSAIGKERLKRLLALAAGGASSQRGIAPVKAKEAGELAEGIATRRGEKAGQLRGVRQQAAAEKAQAAQAAEAAAKAAAQARQPRPSAGDRPMAPAGTPRGEADRAAKAADPDYEFARPSTVGNVGEDLKGSARHKANQWRSLSEAEADGTAAAMVTRDKLLKAEPLDLTEGLTNANYLTRLAGHLALKSFPAQPFTDKALQAYTGKKTPAEMRKLYYDHLQEVKGIIDRRRDDADPREMLAEISRATTNRITAIRGNRSLDTYDRYNPLANSLVDLTNKASRGSYSKTSVTGQINTLGVRLKKANDGKSTAELADVMRNATQEILGGASIDKVTGGQQGNGKWRFSAADHYVGHARREGGRRVGGTPEAATDTIVKGLGFRGLQYGNSVTDDERKHHVQKAAEALVDLADATGLPDKAIGLNGTLGLAIGARGRGGAVAHYEPGMKVINLTRKNGVGSLSHEWGHALDNYAAGSGPSFLSDNRGAPEKRAAMNEVKSAWTKSGYTQQVYESLREIRKGGGLVNDKYWLSDVEMFARSFEAHVSLKLSKAGKANTYLTREFDDSGMKKGNAKERRLGDGLWPTRKQAEEMEPMFDALLAQIRKDDFPGPNNRRDSREERIQRLLQDAYQAAAADHRADATKRKCATGYSCGASCISMSKQCRKTPSGANQQKMTRILALAAGKEGGPAVSGGARAKEAPSSRGGSEKASEGQGKGPASTAKPMTIREMRSAVFKSFNVKSTAALMANKNFQQSVVGDKPRTLKGANAEEEWRQLYRRFVSVPRDERGLKDGGSVINGVDILKNFRPWVAFGLDPKKATKADVDKAFRKLAMKHHPDAGGDRKVFEKLVSMKNSVKALMDSAFQARLDALRARCC
jgi:hypothetical protein